MQDLSQVALPGWYWIAGHGFFERSRPPGAKQQITLEQLLGGKRLAAAIPNAFVCPDNWHGGWVASTESPLSKAKAWQRERQPFLFEGMRFDCPTAAMAAVEVELSNNKM